MPQTVFDEVYEKGVLKSRSPRVVSDAQLELDDAAPRMQQALVTLRAWSQDAKSAAEITAMTASERIQRQAVMENRVAALARLCVALIRDRGVID